MFETERLLTLLKKYDVPGPRYTSYPTVPAWVSSTGPKEYEQSLKTLGEGDKLSLYFHLPFCENLCHFCGCMQVITKDHSRSKAYVDTLLNEIKRVCDCLPSRRMKVIQVHFGGGSPNFLQPSELASIMETVRQSFCILPEAEIAIEMHPRTSTEAFCDVLKPLGFNRISLGVQDLDPHVQKLINRNQTYEMTEAMISSLRKKGLNSFNFDLVYGLPGQSMEGWQKTLSQVLDLKPDRLAVYSYAHVPWVRPVQRTFSDADLPTPQMKIRFFEKAYQTLTHHGYRLIGMDHFALAHDELAIAQDNGTIHRNFMGYTTKAEAHQLGFGVSSISYAGGNYFQNAKELKAYTACIQETGLATFRGFILTPQDQMRRDLIARLMCHGFVDLKRFSSEWEIDFATVFSDEMSQLQSFVEEGLLQVTVEHIKVLGEGFFFLRNMAMVFDQYLESIKSQSKTPTFSRTV